MLQRTQAQRASAPISASLIFIARLEVTAVAMPRSWAREMTSSMRG